MGQIQKVFNGSTEKERKSKIVVYGDRKEEQNIRE